jgi:hypothetical protein
MRRGSTAPVVDPWTLLYEATFAGTGGTDLSSYVSDSGHTHTVRESRSGTQLTGSGGITHVTNFGLYQTDCAMPWPPRYRVTWDLDIHTVLAGGIGITFFQSAGDESIIIRVYSDNTTHYFQVIDIIYGTGTVLFSVNVNLGDLSPSSRRFVLDSYEDGPTPSPRRYVAYMDGVEIGNATGPFINPDNRMFGYRPDGPMSATTGSVMTYCKLERYDA